jgi:UPF0755 protein
MKIILRAILVILLVAAAAAAVVAYRLYHAADAPFQAYDPANPPIVQIEQGMGTQAIGRRLIESGVVKDALTFRVAVWRTGNARRLQAGEYRFDRPLSAIEALDKIARGEVDLLPLTFPEGLTIREMSRVFEDAGFGTAASFVEAAGNGSLVRDLDPDAQDLEGYLFPDTYRLSRRTDATRLVQLMVEGFTKSLTPDIVDSARARGLSVRRLVTLASIVEKETGKAEERPTVASVYSNRLRINMALQCDPTVIFALQRAGRYDGNLRRDDLLFDSPYNTYRYPGLPPGPIAAPGLGSLRAAASPADTDYLYFVSRNDGSHAFASTLAEHNRNVQQFQVDYFRLKRLAERRGQR